MLLSFQANTRRLANIVLILAYHLRRRPRIKTTLAYRHVFAGIWHESGYCTYLKRSLVIQTRQLYLVLFIFISTLNTILLTY